MSKEKQYTDEPVFNLYLELITTDHYRLIMPDADGSLDGIPCPQDGYAVRWPLNPHFTGETGIIELLHATPKFADCSIVYRKGV